jgi:uncharacterized protein (DUF2237 family)
VVRVPNRVLSGFWGGNTKRVSLGVEVGDLIRGEGNRSVCEPWAGWLREGWAAVGGTAIRGTLVGALLTTGVAVYQRSLGLGNGVRRANSHHAPRRHC